MTTTCDPCNEFVDGKCVRCGAPCEHQEVEEGLCLICDMQVIEERPEPDCMGIAHAEHERRMG